MLSSLEWQFSCDLTPQAAGNEWGKQQYNQLWPPGLCLGCQYQHYFYLTHSCILFPCKTGYKLIVLWKISPFNPPAISFSFVTTCYLNYSRSSGKLSSKTTNTKQNHDLSKADSSIHQVLQGQYFTGRIPNNPKLLYSFPISFMLHYIPNLQMKCCQEGSMSFYSKRITGTILTGRRNHKFQHT